LVERILQESRRSLRQVIGDTSFLHSLQPERFATERFGLPTVRDILKELEKPGRDPRPEFRSASLLEGVEELKDLRPGMVLEGTVTNVTNFGAFVDIGVHQDGLVHISALSKSFVKDPHTVVKTGDVVKVKVLDIDEKRRRIALTLRLDDMPGGSEQRVAEGENTRRERRDRGSAASRKPETADRVGSLGSLLQDALRRK
jgi:uncharacterized protein